MGPLHCRLPPKTFYHPSLLPLLLLASCCYGRGFWNIQKHIEGWGTAEGDPRHTSVGQSVEEGS